MKKMRLLVGVLMVSLIFAGCGMDNGTGSSAVDGQKGDITVAALSQIDAWPAWVAAKDGTAEKNGLNYDLKIYEAGIPMVEDLATKEWQIGDAGAVPTMLGVLNRNATIIGIASDESAANAILAKKDSAIFDVEKKEGIYGDADSVRGKSIYTTVASSAHYMLNSYLKEIGLSESDVNIQSASQSDCLEAFKDGKADLVVLWAPFLYQAEEAGGKVVANGSDVGALNLMLYLADKDWAKENAETVANFLAVVSNKAEVYKEKSKDTDKSISEFFEEKSKLSVEGATLASERETHKIFTTKEQLELMESGDAARGMEDIARFFMDINKLAESNYGRLVKNKFNIDTTYLKMADEIEVKE